MDSHSEALQSSSNVQLRDGKTRQEVMADGLQTLQVKLLSPVLRDAPHTERVLSGPALLQVPVPAALGHWNTPNLKRITTTSETPSCGHKGRGKLTTWF